MKKKMYLIRCIHCDARTEVNTFYALEPEKVAALHSVGYFPIMVEDEGKIEQEIPRFAHCRECEKVTVVSALLGTLKGSHIYEGSVP